MSTAETDVIRTTGYPVFPPTAWWQLRKLFQTKGVPKVFDAEYLINLGIRQNAPSANNIIRPFTRFGLFKWVDDSKYAEVCHSILHKIYPEALTSVFTTITPEDQAGVERWFQRNLHLAPASARQYAAFYMLLLRADPAEQEAGNGAQAGRSPVIAPRRSVNSRSLMPKANPQAPSNILPMVPAVALESQSMQESAHPQAPRAHHARGAVEPTLNINVQIHIPAEVTAEQIEQIFKSMAKHLYQRQDEADA
jgi:hypothetical protein